MKQYVHGLVVGKFMPLHSGHIFLLETALSRCQQLTVIVFSHPDEPIPGDLRVNWVREQFPEAEVVHHADPLPRDPDGSSHWDVWKQSIAAHCIGRKFDVVFSSEAYGQRLASDFNAEHVEVDRKRVTHPVSGTDVRDDPSAFRDFIPENVKPFFSDQLT
jgi:HTH-type transcriptional repressor of NAD biosynthesis genes